MMMDKRQHQTEVRGQRAGIRDQAASTRHQTRLTTHHSLLSPNSLRAFTLIELLVVISIIALLIGILLPALGAARTSARISNCLTNVRSIGQATNFYLNDTKRYFPGSYTSTSNAMPNWWNLIGPAGTKAGYTQDADQRALHAYLSSTKVAQCPLDRGDTQDDASAPSSFVSKGSSYIFTNRDYAQISSGQKVIWYGIWSVEGHRDSEILQPTKKVLWADTMIFGGRSATISTNQWHNTEEPLKVSMAFADGHAENRARPVSPNNPGTPAIGAAAEALLPALASVKGYY